jgi:hypothetical protein
MLDVAPAWRFTTIFDYSLEFRLPNHRAPTNLCAPELPFTQPRLDRAFAETLCQTGFHFVPVAIFA